MNPTGNIDDILVVRVPDVGWVEVGDRFEVLAGPLQAADCGDFLEVESICLNLDSEQIELVFEPSTPDTTASLGLTRSLLSKYAAEGVLQPLTDIPGSSD